MSPKLQKIKSIEKVLNLLELLADDNELRITEISQKLNMGITTVYRMLNTLKCQGYVIQNEKNSKYYLGNKLFILGNKIQNTFSLLNIVLPFLKSLSQETIESINFSVLEGKDSLCLSKVDSSEVLRTEVKIGERLPAHCTAVGKAMLAFLPEDELNRLYGNKDDGLDTLTIHSISSVSELMKCLEEIRKKWYALDQEEYHIGVNCLGVPILNTKGISIAGISITGPSSRFNVSQIMKLKDTLISISKDISNHLI